MIHVITHHFAIQAWLEIQKRHLEKYTKNKENVKIHVFLFKTSLPQDFVVPSNYSIVSLDEEGIQNAHHIVVETCYDRFVKPQLNDDDIVVYMDSDAFPIDFWDEAVENNLKDHDISAVYRYEDRGLLQPDQYYPWPHLCFFAFRKKARDLYGFIHEVPDGFPCPGFTMCDMIREKGIKVKEMLRTNKFNSHNVMFGIYDDIIYHQSSGSRAIVGRPYATPGAAPDNNTMCYEGIDFYERREIAEQLPKFIENEVNELNLKIFDAVFSQIDKDTDCNFLRRYYLGKL